MIVKKIKSPFFWVYLNLWVLNGDQKPSNTLDARGQKIIDLEHCFTIRLDQVQLRTTGFRYCREV